MSDIIRRLSPAIRRLAMTGIRLFARTIKDRSFTKNQNRTHMQGYGSGFDIFCFAYIISIMVARDTPPPPQMVASPSCFPLFFMA